MVMKTIGMLLRLKSRIVRLSFADLPFKYCTAGQGNRSLGKLLTGLGLSASGEHWLLETWRCIRNPNASSKGVMPMLNIDLGSMHFVVRRKTMEGNSKGLMGSSVRRSRGSLLRSYGID